MASDGKRLYVSGGDWTHSATDGTWSMDLATGDWRKDHAGPVYPTTPAPHALQDGAGFEWVASRGKFLLWPGAYVPYDAPGASLLEFARGMWWFDPAANIYEQDLRLFPTADGTGCLHGGIYDTQTDTIISFMDDAGARAVRRWDVTGGVRLPDLPLPIASPPGRVAYFHRCRPVQIGRWCYFAGYRTAGARADQTPLAVRWNIDTHATEELPPPPINGPDIRDLEVRLAASHGRLVWPFTNGPEGDIRGIHVYDPEARAWATDEQMPDYGAFICNAVCSLPDGRVAMSGGVFGRQQTHMWFYEAANG